MTDLTRFNLGMGGSMEPDDEGRWVRYEDVAAPVAPAEPAEGWVLVPKRMTQEMRDVTDSEGWTWEDLLAEAGSISQEEYAAIAAAIKYHMGEDCDAALLPGPRHEPVGRHRQHVRGVCLRDAVAGAAAPAGERSPSGHHPRG